MRFWDSSAVVPLLVAEPKTRILAALLRDDRECWIWWATRTECVSALHRRVRSGDLDARQLAVARQRLSHFEEAASIVLPTEAVRSRAERVLSVHPLRAADALQLGALLIAAEERPENLPLVTLDEHLGDAAAREGFTVLPG